MISENIRAFASQQNKTPNLFIFQKTPIGIFSITNVEAEIKSEIGAINWLCLNLAKTMGTISRIEGHILSGLDEDLIQEHLETLLEQNLLKIVNYDDLKLKENLTRLEIEIGNEWRTPMIEMILHQNLIKQYSLTKIGHNAVQSNSKTILDTTTMDIAITGIPFHTFNVHLSPRPNTYKELDMTPELVGQVLVQSQNNSKISGIKPIALTSKSISTGKSVIDAQIWISLLSKNSNLNFEKSTKQLYLTSSTFDKWANPKWDESILDSFPDYNNLKEIIVDAISSTYDMDEDIIDESIELDTKLMVWKLKADLEMSMIIGKKESELLKNIYSEIVLDVPNTNWKITLMLQLDPYFETEDDDLALTALRAGRFHSLANRGGFYYNDGYELWKQIMKDWKQNTGIKEYQETLDLLVKNKCLVERLPNINKIIVDVDGILNYDKRGSQSWDYNRLKQVIDQLKSAGIDNITYIITNQFMNRIDQEKNAQKWMDTSNVETVEFNSNNVHPTIALANKQNAHFLGNQTIPKTKDFKKLRINSKQLKYKINRNKISISGLELLYEWRMDNIFEKMYEEYY